MNKEQDYKAEIKALKEKLKKKSLALRKANEKVGMMKADQRQRSLWRHQNNLESIISDSILMTIPVHVYDVWYKYNGVQYKEEKVKCHLPQLLGTAVALALTRRLNAEYWPHEIKIIKAEKLW